MSETGVRMMLEWGVMFAVAIIATLLLLTFAKKQAARFSGKGGRSYGEVVEEQTAEMKRLNDYLEKSGAVNEERFLRIETRLAELEKRVS